MKSIYAKITSSPYFGLDVSRTAGRVLKFEVVDNLNGETAYLLPKMELERHNVKPSYKLTTTKYVFRAHHLDILTKEGRRIPEKGEIWQWKGIGVSMDLKGEYSWEFDRIIKVVGEDVIHMPLHATGDRHRTTPIYKFTQTHFRSH